MFNVTREKEFNSSCSLKCQICLFLFVCLSVCLQQAGRVVVVVVYHNSPSFSLAGTSMTLGLSMILAVR